MSRDRKRQLGCSAAAHDGAVRFDPGIKVRNNDGCFTRRRALTPEGAFPIWRAAHLFQRPGLAPAALIFFKCRRSLLNRGDFFTPAASASDQRYEGHSTCSQSCRWNVPARHGAIITALPSWKWGPVGFRSRYVGLARVVMSCRSRWVVVRGKWRRAGGAEQQQLRFTTGLSATAAPTGAGAARIAPCRAGVAITVGLRKAVSPSHEDPNHAPRRLPAKFPA